MSFRPFGGDNTNVLVLVRYGLRYMSYRADIFSVGQPLTERMGLPSGGIIPL